MAFTEFPKYLTPMVDLAQVLAGLGVITVLLAVLKRYAERRCWRAFKVRVDDWIDRLRETANRHPRELDDHEWKAACERMPTDSKFSPLEITQMLDTAVVVARGRAADKFFL